MEFRILGSFEVVGSAGVLDLRGVKRRGLLACLVVHAGEPMSTDRLVEELWGGGGSGGAGRTVQTYVSQLRKLLRGEAASLETRPGGYALEADPRDVDANRFEQAVIVAGAEPDPAGRLAVVDEALALWRGPPLDEFAGAGWADREAARLEGLHLQAQQRRYDALMELDRAREAVAELEALVGTHALDERLWWQLMLVLYRSGRQADALGAYQQARSRLVDQLGIEPGPELAELEHRILEHDPTLVATTSRPASADTQRISARGRADRWYPRTLLLTDIVDSVALWERDPEAMSEAVARHEALIQGAVTASRGELVRTKGEGDSTFSVFVHPSDALEAAAAIQLPVAGEDRSSAAPIRVRVGVHTGDAEQRDGDWYGPAVNRAARLRALAEGGQALVSGLTAGLVADRMPEGVRLLYRGRRVLRGIERPEEVWELVTAGDPRLVTTGGLPSQELPPALELLADASSFVGRSDERDRLRGLWQRARAGQLLVAMVTGEAGMGKSRLVAELAAEVQRDGGRVLLGSCFEDLGVPYEPFVQALTADVAGLADAEVRRRVGTHGRAVGRLVPELVPLLGGRDPGVAAGGVADRAEVYAALSDYLCRAAEGAPLLLVLEDLHWSTPTTRRALRHLARAGRRAPILVVVTARDSPPDLDQALATFLGDLARHPAVATVALSGLAESEIRDLLSGVHSDVDPVSVCADTGGNPLLAAELAAAGQRGATSLASMLAARYQRLAPRDLEVLDLAAVVGSEFDARLLAAAETTSLTEVLEALERAEAAGVVTASPGQPGRFSFVHALFRSIRYDGLPGSRRLALHRRAVEALRPRAHDERVLPELARHACIAAPLGQARTALDYARRAGETAERLLAMDEAAFHYRAALEMDDLLDPPDPQRRLRLRIALGAALLYAGDPEGRRTLLASARDARTLANPDALTAVALAFAWHVMGATASVERADADVVSVFEDALNATVSEPSARRARLLAGLSAELVFTDLDRSHRLVTDAVAMARPLDDPRTLGQTLLTHRYVYREPGRSDEGTSIYEELLSLGQRLDEPVFITAALAELLYAHREVGDLERAAEIELELAAALGDRPLVMARLYLTTCRASGRFLAGDLLGAQQLAKDVISLALEAGFQPAVWYGPPRIALRYQQGRIAEMIPDLRDVAFSSVGYATYAAAVLASGLARTGRRDDATEVLTPLAARGSDVFHAQNWFTGTVDLVDAVELLGDRAAAAVLHDRLAPFEGRIAGSNFSISRPVGQALCQLALTLDDLEGATAVAHRAIAASRRRGTPIFLGRELILFAAARVKAGDTREGVAALVDEALQIAEATGALLINQEAERYGLI